MPHRVKFIGLAWLAIGTGCASRERAAAWRPSGALPAPIESAARSSEVPQAPESAVDTVPHGDCADGWCWENPLPRGEAMRAIWGSASDNYWAAGGEGTLLHFDGARWSRAKLAEPFVASHLFGRVPHDVYAIGGGARHFDGHGWARVPGVVEIGEALGGFSEHGAPWIISLGGAVSTFDGKRWRERLPSSCHADGCGWYTYRTASGGTATPRPSGVGWDGTFPMTRLPSPVGRTFGGTRESRLVLVRDASSGYVQAWRHGSWVDLPVPNAATPHEQRPLLRSIWGASDDDAWVVGKHGALFHFDGTSWTAFASGTRGELWDVWGTSHDDVWAVGDSALLHWDGHAWKPARSSASEASLNGVWALGGCAAWAVGDAGVVLRRDCSGWTAVASGVTSNLYGVWGSDARNVWMVGAQGMLLHFDGKAFETRASPSKATLHGLWGSGAADLWAVGERGAILHFDGTRWRELPSPTERTLLRVRGTQASRVLAVGENGVLIAWDGEHWIDQKGPACPGYGGGGGAAAQTGVVPITGDEEWVLCSVTGPAHHVLGAWQVGGFGGTFTDLVAAGPELVLAGAGRLLERDGNGHWRDVGDLALPLRSLATAPDGRVFAVGERGIILSRAPAAK